MKHDHYCQGAFKLSQENTTCAKLNSTKDKYQFGPPTCHSD